MNPIANTPIFLGLTADDTSQVRKKVAAKSLITSFIIVAFFALLGKMIFHLFGITLPAFRIMGGALVTLIGYHMLHGEQSPVHQPSTKPQQHSIEDQLSVAITPLAMPILAGPGTITAAMNNTASGGIMEMAVTIIAFAVLCWITYLFFIYGERLVHFLGHTGLSVVTRIMGLILGVIGVQMLIAGVAGAVKAYQ